MKLQYNEALTKIIKDPRDPKAQALKVNLLATGDKEWRASTATTKPANLSSKLAWDR